ncbi:hypothetical protein Pla175_50920 [Pirellulimonas nuda]|uniref:Zinc finger/thioredoxin putative domain-containing protein n=1 Tax=Pirellulimonas nuda TaxID=2528009 RepID=A0A518DJP6_9BACT|nr:hypothetical protein [Pirellulimonas nuda]QDU91662.1 hypothetical protein Pla175_50920 [Pirellulimonas nuda]
MPGPPPPPPPSSVRLACARCGNQFSAALGTDPAEALCGACGMAAATATQPPVPPPPPPPKPPAAAAPDLPAAAPDLPAAAPKPSPAAPPPPPPIRSKVVDVKVPVETPPAPTRPMTRAEREAARRKLNMILAVVGAVILALAFLLLSQLG